MLLIRPARSSDAEAMLNLYKNVMVATYVDIVSTDVKSRFVESINKKKQPPFTTQLDNRIADPKRWTTLVAFDEQQNRPQGYLMVTHYQDHDYISNFYVQPQAQGQGIGKTLLLTFLDQASHDVVLYVVNENRRAQAFYDKLGFQDEGITGKTFFGLDLRKMVWRQK